MIIFLNYKRLSGGNALELTSYKRGTETQIFHAKASQWQWHNFISQMEDLDGRLLSDSVNIGECSTNYFMQLFQSTEPSREDNGIVLDGIAICVSQPMNDIMSLDFTPVEVINSIKHMSPSKSPGPDGLTALFFQNFWNIVKSDVTSTILAFLNKGIISDGFNHTKIALIPKIKDATDITCYRPISLCNVIYKIASRMVVNRLKSVLPTIISDYQNACPRITHNI